MSDYSKHMWKTVEVVESWLYNQGFYGTNLSRIPHGMQTHLDTDNGELVIPYETLFSNLTGVNIAKITGLNKQDVPNNMVDKTTYLWRFYDEIIRILISNGAFLPFVDPEYLLDYNLFLIFVEKIAPNLNLERKILIPATRPQYLMICKQHWMDLLLQTYKVFVVCRTVNNSLKCPDLDDPNVNKMIDVLNDLNPAYVNSMYNPTENVLMCWLELNYNEMKSRVWSKAENLPKREVRFFDMDLCDGIIIACTVARYCPFIRDRFENLYLTPYGYDQAVSIFSLFVYLFVC